MIGGVNRHGRTRRDVRNLSAHLLKDAAVVRIANSIAPDLPAALDDMLFSMEGSRATSAFLHMHLSPARQMTETELRKAAMIVLRHFDAVDHPTVFVIHEKERDGGDGVRHAHLVVGRVGPDGNVLASGFEKIRLETAMRIAEYELGEKPVLGRHHASALRWLRQHDRDDVADWLESAHGPEPEKPTSVSSPRKRQAIERKGASLVSIRRTVRHAWSESGTPEALSAALLSHGLSVEPGDKSGVWVISRDNIVVGSLDRIVRVKRKAVNDFMTGQSHAARVERMLVPKPRPPRPQRPVDPDRISRIDLDELRWKAEAYARSVTRKLRLPANPDDERKRLKTEIQAVSERLSTKGASRKPNEWARRASVDYDSLGKSAVPRPRR